MELQRITGEQTGKDAILIAGVNFIEVEKALNNQKTLIGIVTPTTTTKGAIGQYYLDTAADKLYVCKAAEADVYTWKLIDEYVRLQLEQKADISQLIPTETGIWTPLIECETTNGTVVYTTQTGTYTRIGKLIKCDFLLVFTLTGGTGALNLAGLPMIPSQYYKSGVISQSTIDGVGSNIIALANTSNINKPRFFLNSGLFVDSALVNTGKAVVFIGSITYNIA